MQEIKDGIWYECKVVNVGPAEDGNIYIWLQNTGTPEINGWYIADPSIKEPALSVAIAAMVNNLKVQVALSSAEIYSKINRFYLTTVHL